MGLCVGVEQEVVVEVRGNREGWQEEWQQAQRAGLDLTCALFSDFIYPGILAGSGLWALIVLVSAQTSLFPSANTHLIFQNSFQTSPQDASKCHPFWAFHTQYTVNAFIVVLATPYSNSELPNSFSTQMCQETHSLSCSRVELGLCPRLIAQGYEQLPLCILVP